MRQVRQLCFAGTYSNPSEKLDDHPFLLGLLVVRINDVPFSLVLSGRRVANHVLVLSMRAFSKLNMVKVVFLIRVSNQIKIKSKTLFNFEFVDSKIANISKEYKSIR